MLWISVPFLELVLSYNNIIYASANPLVRNDDGQTPLNVARSRGFVNVVRAIEVFFGLTNVISFMVGDPSCALTEFFLFDLYIFMHAFTESYLFFLRLVEGVLWSRIS